MRERVPLLRESQGMGRPSLRMQDRESARKLASWCSLGPGQCGVLLEGLRGGDGMVWGTWTRRQGREGQELAPGQLCEHRRADLHQF